MRNSSKKTDDHAKMKWQVQITGDQIDLERLAESLSSNDPRILKYRGAYFIESNRFARVSEPEKIKSITTEILEVLTGVVRLSSLGGKTPLQVANVDCVLPNGQRVLYLEFHETLHISTSMNVEVETANGEKIVVTEPPSKISPWTTLGLTNTNVAKAFRLLGKEKHTWVNLYRIYEVIEEDVGSMEKIVKCGWATKTSIKRFKHTANSPGAAGDASRHGKESTTPPSNPMDINEGRALIEIIFHGWLHAKVL